MTTLFIKFEFTLMPSNATHTNLLNWLSVYEDLDVELPSLASRRIFDIEFQLAPRPPTT